MKRLSDFETALVKHYNITPENISDKMQELSYADVATWSMHNGFAQVYDKISAAIALESIYKKFWDEDGFDAPSLEDVAAWVLTTYLDEDTLMTMSSDEIIQYLQNWKYYAGFRKQEGNGEFYRQLAFDVWGGRLIQVDGDPEICYMEVE